MAFQIDGMLDPEQALRLLDHLSGESEHDYVMMIENKGTVVEGESERLYEDGKKRMDIGGFVHSAEVVVPPGAGKGKARANTFIVIRECDAASASIASLLKNQDSEIKVQVSVFKAGGDNSKDMQPTLEFALEGVRVTLHTIVSGGRPKRPCEIILMQYRKIEIKSAPQKSTGARGAVRTCSFSNV